ncbi:MAG: hypothetical protein JSS31_14580 [Proteobacteria bacterium]|nr:hypothetical protein [Pseudomonadota bacterium]MBS0495140.1 hypothetical protein [Pseudomonadota bacterium]
MAKNLKRMAARLTFSLLTLGALGGCAVYAPPPGPYTYYGTDADGQAVYAAPPVAYPAAPVYATPYSPYYYGPAYVGPPIGLNLGFSYWRGGGGHSWGGGRGGGRGWSGGHGGGFHGGGRGGGGRR